ncbi:acyltransferase family protein [Photobacterium rosenbergii]|uniref:acyltransferase family protein n=1 Tax=Photobacterium rosenbergii TaxID=294936 RepID=UPI001C995B36|nr:acyltransferase [Photobacterium rosenbergii]MBY5946453.1 acyltransferase [Photobacterium rosenbergii]
MVKRFESLDAFRGLCAISVVVFHMHLVGSITELSFFRGSAIFVEFFFVLSGFVLAHGYGFRNDLMFKPFVKARFFRLFPLHIFMLGVMIVLEFGKLFAYKFAGFSFNNEPFTGPGAVSEIIPNLLLLQSWTPFTNPLTFNYPSWSISVEFYMYILLFISICLFKGRKGLGWALVSLIMLYGIFVDSDTLTKEVFRGLSCFFGGAFMYTFYRKIEHLKLSFSFASIIEILSIFLVVYVVSSDFENRTICAIAMFFIIVTIFAFDSGVISYLLKKKPFQTAGKLSYSIYMIHAAFLFCLTSSVMVLQKVTGIEMAPMINGMRFLTIGDAWMNNILVFFIVGLVILASTFTYNFIELKGQQIGKRL